MAHSSREAARVGNAINLVLGVWLMISTFVWPHSDLQRVNCIAVGLLIALVAVGSLWVPAMSCVDTLPAVWLLAGALFLVHGSGITPYHNAIIGALVIFASTTPLVAFTHTERTAYQH